METALLILILTAGDPASQAAAEAIAEALRLQEPKAQVVLPPDAAKQLQTRGMADGDLVKRSEKPLLATAQDLRLVLVRVERRESGADRVVEVELWSGGRHDRMAAVTGKDGEPLPPAVEGAQRLLREASHDAASAADRADLAMVAGFAERGDWQGLIAAVAARPQASPRLRHAVILAHLRLGNRLGASAALAMLKESAPQHPLTAAAAAAVEADAADAGPELRDAKPVDDGGNVLR